MKKTLVFLLAGQSNMAGLLWMQGERDSVFAFMARKYAANLVRFIRHVRHDTASPGLPVIMGRISPRVYDMSRMVFQHVYRTVVQKAQDCVARSCRRVRLVQTDDLPQGDNLHYTTGGQLVLGRRFAEAWLSLPSRPGRAGDST